MLPCFYDVYTVVVNTSCCHTSDLASWGAKKNNFQSCKQERSSRDQVNPTCDILGSYSKTSRIDFIWPIGICPTRGILFQNDASYLWYQHLRCFVDKTTDQCWFLQSRMGVAKTAAFAADVFNDLLEVRAGRGWYFPVSIYGKWMHMAMFSLYVSSFTWWKVTIFGCEAWPSWVVEEVVTCGL